MPTWARMHVVKLDCQVLAAKELELDRLPTNVSYPLLIVSMFAKIYEQGGVEVKAFI